MNVKKIVLVAFAGFVMLTSVQCQMKEAVQTSTEQNKALVRRLVEQVWNKGNLAVIDEILSPDYVLHISAPGSPDRDGYKQAVSMYHKAFADFSLTIEDMIAEADKVVIRCTLRGTHKGQYMGVAPTGKQVSLSVISIRRIEDGKIVEEWVELDMLGLMQQLGAVPSPG
jgi:steroid delta-isomerase-like uncharacterized protein